MPYNREIDGVTFDANGRPVAPWSGTAATAKNRVATAVVLTVGFQAVIWAVFLAEVLSGFSLTRYGLHPRSTTWLPGIITFPFLHAGLGHIVGNAGISVVLVFLIGLSGWRAFAESTGVILLLGGLLTWIVGTGVIVGASGLIYGWVVYLVVRGFFNRSLWQILVGLALGFTYAGLVFGFMPQPAVSWQAHLCGAVAGFAAAKWITSDDPATKAARALPGGR